MLKNETAETMLLHKPLQETQAVGEDISLPPVPHDMETSGKASDTRSGNEKQPKNAIKAKIQREGYKKHNQHHVVPLAAKDDGGADQKPQPKQEPSNGNADSDNTDSARNDGGQQESRESAPPKPKQPKPKPKEGDVPDADDDDATTDDTTPPDDADLPDDTAPLKEQGGCGGKPENSLKPNKDGRLLFTEDESAPQKPNSRKLVKAERQLEKTGGKLEKARENLPVKRKPKSRLVFDEKKGKAKRELYFEKTVKSQKEHLKGPLPFRPVKAGVNSAIVFGHKKLYQVQHENVGIQAGHKGEMMAEAGIRTALRHRKTAPYRRVAKLEHKLMKKNVNAAYRKALEKNPKLKSNMLSRMWQKRQLKKKYAKQLRETQKTAQKAAKAAQKAGNAVQAMGRAIIKNPKVVIIMLLLGFILMLILSMCSVMGSFGMSGSGAVAVTTYLAEDDEIYAAQEAYAEMEADLQDYLDNYETHNPGYDEYVYILDEMWHDPYSLISILSAFHVYEWTLDDVLPTLAMLFDLQYILTETVTVDVRTETVDGEEVEYDHYIMTVKLENFNLSHLPIYMMSEEQLGLYAMYMWSLGNRPDLFPVELYPRASYYREVEEHDIPPEYLEDPVFAAMMEEAQRHIGMPYIWGGYSPITSFDCSGFVSWVLNQSGWDIGRLGAQGLYNISAPVSVSDARPGDLVFFVGTYAAPDPDGVTHVGIYVGDGMMIHAGNPIGFTSIETDYWQNHFLAFGRP